MSDNLTITLDRKSYLSMMMALSNLKDIEKTAAVKQGMSAGAAVIRRETAKNMRQRVQVRKGNLKKSLTRKTTVKKKEPRAYIGFKRPAGAASHLIDKGTKDRWTKGKNGKPRMFRGKVTPRLFHTDSFERKKEEAVKVMAKYIQIGISRITSRRYY